LLTSGLLSASPVSLAAFVLTTLIIATVLWLPAPALGPRGSMSAR
jgi:hypothetical protein